MLHHFPTRCLRQLCIAVLASKPDPRWRVLRIDTIQKRGRLRDGARRSTHLGIHIRRNRASDLFTRHSALVGIPNDPCADQLTVPSIWDSHYRGFQNGLVCCKYVLDLYGKQILWSVI